MSKGKFIVFEGGDGAGKTTMVKKVESHLAPNVVRTREPGGSENSEPFRETILSDGLARGNAKVMFSLFWTSRCIHVKEKISPALENGSHVVSDRFDLSTWAYQIFGQENQQLREPFLRMREQCLGTCVPDCYIILDIDPEVAHTRMHEREEKLTHFDERDRAFHERVREGFRSFSEISNRCYFVDARQSIDEVEANVMAIVEGCINRG